MPFEPIKAPNLAEAAAKQIRSLISNDIIQPGDALPGERELAEQMQISRTSVRSALKALIAEGILISKHGSGIKVASTITDSITSPLIKLMEDKPEFIEDYLGFRTILECECAAISAINGSKEEHAEIHRVNELMKNSWTNQDYETAEKWDVEFHMAIVETTRNVVSIQIARSLHELLQKSINNSHSILYGKDSSIDELIEQHNMIVEAILKRDAVESKKAMKHHLTYQIGLLKSLKQEEYNRSIVSKRRSWSKQ